MRRTVMRRFWITSHGLWGDLAAPSFHPPSRGGGDSSSHPGGSPYFPDVTRPVIFHFLLVLTTASLQAGGLVIEKRPFQIEATFNATLMPEGGATPLRIGAKSWQDFRLIEMASHGASVPKGALVLKCDPSAIDQKLDDIRRAVSTSKLAVARTSKECALLRETSPQQLAALRQTAEIAKQEHDNFTKTQRKTAEENAAQAHEGALKVSLPRQAITLANNAHDAAIAHRSAEEQAPLAIQAKELELAALETQLQRQIKSLAELEHDRTLCEWKAPTAGTLYHGPIENGRWIPGDHAKNLVVGGRLPVHRPFAAFIPATAKLGLVAFLAEADARSLKSGLTGTATLAGREDVEIPVKLSRLDVIPGTDGSYRADLSADWPGDLVPVTGASAAVRIVFYQQASAITVPSNALLRSDDGWTAEVKLTDGKSERRPVKRGRISGETTEILAGLEVGQVILIP